MYEYQAELTRIKSLDNIKDQKIQRERQLSVDKELEDLKETFKKHIPVKKSNELTKLPKLPKSLKIIDIDNNKLIDNPFIDNILPDSLEILHCCGNEIIKLPNLPNKLEKLMCNNNKLKY